MYYRRTKSKYGNKKSEFEGITFDSVKERDRYIFLSGQLKEGNIRDLQRQVKFQLIPARYENKIVHLKTKTKLKPFCVSKAENYFADFTYYRTDNNEFVVEDVKGLDKRTGKPFVTREFILKSKIFELRYGFDITIITDTTKF